MNTIELQIESVQEFSIRAYLTSNVILIKGISKGSFILKEGDFFNIKLPENVRTIGQQFLMFDEFGYSVAKLEIGSTGIVSVLKINNSSQSHGSFLINSILFVNRY